MSGPVPSSSSLRSRLGRSCQGVLTSMPLASATASSRRRWYIDAAFTHGSSAPSEIESVGSGTISSGSITRRKPSPWHCGQHPCGELKEKILGSSSGIEVPQFRHAKRSEKTRTSPRLPADGPLSTEAPGASSPLVTSAALPASSSSTSTSPSASWEAASIDSARRLRSALLHHQAVDDDRDVVLELLVEHDLLVEASQLAVDHGPHVTLLAHFLEHPPVLALALPDDGRQDHEPRSLAERHHPVGDLLDRLPGDRLAAVVAVGLADPRPQQAQVVVDLGDRADGGAGVSGGRLLVDRDRGREPLDRVHVGLVHLAEELARVGRERLDVAALALGVDRVEGEAGLARAGEPGHHDQRVAGHRQVDALEVVRASA